MHLFFSTPIWSAKITNYKDVNEELYNYISKSKKTESRRNKKKVISMDGTLKILI